ITGAGAVGNSLNGIFTTVGTTVNSSGS
ncbi:Flp family type IVb pilin, partial [Mesorhizobium sp. M7A.F.Ca.CA.002.15.1.1]